MKKKIWFEFSVMRGWFQRFSAIDRRERERRRERETMEKSGGSNSLSKVLLSLSYYFLFFFFKVWLLCSWKFLRVLCFWCTSPQVFSCSHNYRYTPECFYRNALASFVARAGEFWYSTVIVIGPRVGLCVTFLWPQQPTSFFFSYTSTCV